MNRWSKYLIVMGILGLLTGCAGNGGGRVGVGFYHHRYGPGPWWGYRDYYVDRRPIVVVPPDIDGTEPIPELPIEPSQPAPEIPDIPDMGMPDIDFPDIDF